ncbi:Hsp70 protein-domain-containing protein [Elsinoe ampelina]|uniref:Hsp70 protein-domain-containing protein n=1 Tax=Elsinoe ampelina TaxID=302913 RepID=A0A6A6GHW7_9PEZI|nr:Hsp70 protein-domain-containing protein [Elsinoe ampelina]
MSDGEEIAGKVAIGISFGNSYSSIAFTGSDGKAEVIANEEGDRQIPSILSYVEGEEFHGTQAKAQLVRNPKNTVAYFRDFIGKDFKSIDPTPCHPSAHPSEQSGTIAFSIKDTEADQQNNVTVSEITTRHLRRLQKSASDYLGKEVQAAVITVPTNFSEEQRKALEEAAKGAGLEILQIIHEPAAALLAYDARSTDFTPKDKIVVLADLGGTRSDIAVVASRGGIYTILATSHDYELGGAVLDQTLIDYAAKEFQKKHKTDPRQNERSLSKLKLEAEAVKKSLSIGASASFSIESLADGVDFSLTVNRTRFELLANKHFSAITRLIESTIQKADLDPLDIGEIILSGGTSHIPKIARNLQSAFPQRTTVLSPSTSPTAINPSELSARGAAIQASLISEFEKDDIEQSTHPVVTATPHLATAIGISTVAESVGEEVFGPIVEPNTAVPVRRTIEIPAPKNGGDVLVRICEGVSEIKVTKPEPKEKPATNGDKDSDDDDDDDDDEDEEEADIREKLWKQGKVLAEAGLKGVKKGGKVEVQVDVKADLSVSFIVREVGGKGGVRGSLAAGKVGENGSA